MNRGGLGDNGTRTVRFLARAESTALLCGRYDVTAAGAADGGSP